MSRRVGSIEVYAGCVGDCGGNECSSAKDCGCGSNYRCNGGCCVENKPSPDPGGSCPCGGSYPNCTTCTNPPPPGSGNGGCSGGCGNKCCNGNACETCVVPPPPGGGPCYTIRRIHFYRPGQNPLVEVSNDPACPNFWTQYSVSVTAGGTPASCTQSACGTLVCTSVCGTSNWRVSVGAPSNYQFPRVDAWRNDDPGTNAVGTASFTNVKTATYSFTSGADGNVAMTLYRPTYICNRTRTVVEIANSRNGPWRTNFLTSRNTPPYPNVRVLVSDLSGNPIPAVDSQGRVDVSQNGTTIKSDINDNNEVYLYKYDVSGTLPNGTYTVRAAYQGSRNGYWCSSSGLATLVVNRSAPPSRTFCDSITPNVVTGTSPTAVNFSVSGRTVNGGFVERYRVDYGDGVVETKFASPYPTFSHTYINPITTTARGYAIDDNDRVVSAASCEAPVTITTACQIRTCAYYQDPAVDFAGCAPASFCIAGNKTYPCASNTCFPTTYDLSCNSACPATFFKTFGGDVTAVRSIDDSGLPLEIPVGGQRQYLSMDDSTTNSPAGLVGFNAFTRMTAPLPGGSTRFSQQPNPPGGTNGWNLDNTYNFSGTLSVLNYDVQLQNVLKNAGLDTANFSATDCNLLYGNIFIRCYGSAVGLDAAISSALSDTGTYVILVPTPGVLVTDGTISTPKSIVNSKRVVVFVNGNLNVRANVISNQLTSGIVFILKNAGGSSIGNVTVQNPALVTILDGAYVFPGQFSSGAGNVPLNLSGLLIGWGSALTPFPTGSMGRDPGVLISGENYRYNAKYLYLFKNVLGRPKITWKELSPK